MRRVKFKNLYILLLLSIVSFSSGYSAYATNIHEEGGIIPNHSAEYVRTLNRNASTDVDAAFYNPAGLVFLKKNGLYAMFSNQTMIVNRTMDNNVNQISGSVRGGFAATPVSLHLGPVSSPLSGSNYNGRQYNEYDLDVFAPALPDLNIVYKKDDFAGYFNFAVLQATPTHGVIFENGSPTIDNAIIATYTSLALADLELDSFDAETVKLKNYTREASLTRHEQYLSTSIGVAYRIIEMLSASLGVRFISAALSTEIEYENILLKPTGDWWNGYSLNFDQVDPFDSGKNNIVAKTEGTGYGFGFIAGTHIRPIDNLDIGMRFEYYTPLKIKNETSEFDAPLEVRSSGDLDLLRDGVETNVTFPPSASIGVSYKIIEELRVEVGFDYYFRKMVDYGPEVSDNKNLYYVTNKNSKHRMRKDHWNNGYRAGCAVEVILAELKISMGYSYSDPGIKEEYVNEGRALVKSHTVGTGASYEWMDDLVITVGGFYLMGIEAEVTRTDTNTALNSFNGATAKIKTDVTQKFNETRYGFGFGVTYRLDI